MPWWRHLTPQTLAGKFLALQLGLLALVLAVAGVVTERQATSQFIASSRERILGATESLADNPLVRTRGEHLNLAPMLAPVVEAARIQSGATVVLVAGSDHRILAGTDPTLVGESLSLPDDAAWAGRAWDGDLDLAGDSVSAATAPVYSDSGQLLGLALMGEKYPSVWSILLEGVPELLFLIALAAAAGVTGSWLLARRIKKQTHGLEPAEIATLADHRAALLHSIREGVLGLGPDGRITVANDAACLLLSLPADCVGQAVRDLDLDPGLMDVLLGRSKGSDLVVTQGDRVLVVNRRTATFDRKQGEVLGTVITFRDRSDLIAVQRQLGATRNATDTLRAQTHEFDNQLHIISGLVQFGRYDDVRRYVGELTERRTQLSLEMTERIEDAPLAALLLAKSSLAAESSVQLIVTPTSHCSELPAPLSTDVSTVVGNLIDNALDAVSNSAEAAVTVDIRSDDAALTVSVTDTGPGVAPDDAPRVFDRGYTTKSAAVVGGRGIGLSLVKRVCEHRGGYVTFSTGPGATFTAILPIGAVIESTPAGAGDHSSLLAATQAGDES